MVPSAWKLVLYGLVIVVGSLFALPNLLTPAQREAWPDWLPSKPVALGLDLRGGAHLVLEIDARALRREQMETLLGDAQAVLREARIGGVRGAIEADVVVLQANTPQVAAAAERVLRASDTDAASAKKIEVAPDGSIRLSLEPASLAAREQSALQQSIEIVRRRIDAIGVAEPTVQALGSSRILVQLPGVQDPASIRKLLGSTAKLTFHRVESTHARGSGTVPAGSIRVPASDEAVDYGLQRRHSYRVSGSCTQAPASIRRMGAESSRFASMMWANECSRRSPARTSAASWPLFSMTR